MRIALDIDGPVADTLRAIGLALEDPGRSVGLAAEVGSLEERISRLLAQHETDTMIIEGLREQLSRKDSPAPALPIALPPVRIEGLAPEKYVSPITIGKENTDQAADVAGPHSPRGQAAEDTRDTASTQSAPLKPTSLVSSKEAPGADHTAPALPCMLFCGAAALKDPESGGWFCRLHIAVPLSIRLEAKRAFRKEAARG